MKKVFDCESGAELLISECAKQSGIKIGKLINSAIYDYFMPETMTLRVEAAYILQKHEDGELSQFIICQCISRAISWLARYPVENCGILRSILLHYTSSPFIDDDNEDFNDYVLETFAHVVSAIKKINPDYSCIHRPAGNFGEDICFYWDNLWKDPITYDVLSSIVYILEPQKAFTWFDGMMIIKGIENVAKSKYSLK